MFDKYEKIRLSGLKILDIMDLSIILGLKTASSRVIASRMVRKGILARLKRDLYLLNNVNVYDFEIANRLINPSYISFESALNYWGITTQIPVIITSVARRSKGIIIKDKEFIFSNLPEELFSIGIMKRESFFIACPEKAVLDMVYYASLGKRSITFDEFDTSRVNRGTLNFYLNYYPERTKYMLKEIIK
jgi:predicted transcriptional regulator of viral defense system